MGGSAPLPGEVIRHILEFCADQYGYCFCVRGFIGVARSGKMTISCPSQYLGVDINDEKAAAPVMGMVEALAQ